MTGTAERIARIEDLLAHTPCPVSRIEKLVRELRMGAAKARRHRDKVTFTVDPAFALTIANRLEVTESHLAARAKCDADLRDLVETAQEVGKDETLRFQMAVHDLETLLMQFIGRPHMTMAEVRQQRSQMEARPSAGPQPFRRSKSGVPISDALRQSIASGRIGKPRDPGEEG